MDAQVNQFFTGFIQDIANLKILIADYNTSFINLKATYGNLTPEQILEKMSEQDKASLLALLNNIRRFSFSLYVDVQSIKSDLQIENEKEFENAYTQIENEVLFDYSYAKTFIQTLNDIKTKNINVQALIINETKDKIAYEAMQTPRSN